MAIKNNVLPGGRQELLESGLEQSTADCQEGGRSLDLDLVLLVEMFVDGWEEHAAGHWEGGS